MGKRPNFVFIMTDQQRADWTGHNGHPVLKTPHIDALAASGLAFQNFHVASPVCMPNRASFMTGRYPTTHGLRYNGCLLSTRAATFVEALRASGYDTAAIGKSHLQPMTEHAPLFKTDGAPGPIAEAWRDDAGDYVQEEPGRYQSDDLYAFKTPYYGYDHVDMVTYHGDRCGGHYGQWFRSQTPDWKQLHDPAAELPHDYTCPQAYRTPVPEALYPTSYVRDRTIEHLESKQNSDAPFFTFVSFPDPHHPFNPPGKYWDMYDPSDFDVRLPFEAHKNPTPPMRFLDDSRRRGETPMSLQTAFMASERHLQEAMALTAGMISMVDDAVGDVVAALKRLGLYDDTVICFNADHGDYLGDFNMLLKGALPFRGITRVPMVWSDPAYRDARRTDALASTVDLPATILERAGVGPYYGMQAKSFMPLVRGETASHRDALFIEYNDGGPRLGFDTPSRVRAVVTPEHRYTMYKDETWGELYNLADDPDETNNLWDDPDAAATKADLSLRLNHMLTDLMDESPRALRRA